jgi:hypothetical protein
MFTLHPDHAGRDGTYGARGAVKNAYRSLARYPVGKNVKPL